MQHGWNYSHCTALMIKTEMMGLITDHRFEAFVVQIFFENLSVKVNKRPSTMSSPSSEGQVTLKGIRLNCNIWRCRYRV